MRIPVLYLVLSVLVIAVLFGLRGEMKQIAIAAEKQTEIQAVKDLEAYKQGAQKIKDAEKATKRGLVFLKHGDTARAEILFARATEINPVYYDAAFYAGYAQLKGIEKEKAKLTLDKQHAKLKSAKNYLLSAQKLDPLSPINNKLLAMISEQQGNDKEAKLWYARYKEVGGK